MRTDSQSLTATERAWLEGRGQELGSLDLFDPDDEDHLRNEGFRVKAIYVFDREATRICNQVAEGFLSPAKAAKAFKAACEAYQSIYAPCS